MHMDKLSGIFLGVGIALGIALTFLLIYRFALYCPRVAFHLVESSAAGRALSAQAGESSRFFSGRLALPKQSLSEGGWGASLPARRLNSPGYGAHEVTRPTSFGSSRPPSLRHYPPREGSVDFRPFWRDG